MKNYLAIIEADIKAAFDKVQHLLYTPVVQHPELEKLRQTVVAQIQAHQQQVMQSLVSMGNTVLQQAESALLSKLPPTVATVAAPVVAEVKIPEPPAPAAK